MKITNHHELRQRTSLDVSSPLLTEQEHKNSCDINHIVAQFQKTGVMPPNTKIPQYLDSTNIPSLEDAFRTVSEARTAFLDLPANIRRLMDNDPSQMEQFLSNNENAEILLKYGVIQERITPEPETTLKDVVNVLKESTKQTEKA